MEKFALFDRKGKAVYGMTTLFTLLLFALNTSFDSLSAPTIRNTPFYADTDGDGLTDDVDDDDDGDGLPDTVEGQDTDTDSDGLPDHLDLDSDNDGILDQRESSIRSNDFDCQSVPNLDFSAEPILESGLASSEGAIYRIPNVTEGLDALISLEEIVNGRIDVLDQNSTDPAYFKPEIEFRVSDTVRKPYVDLRISLVASGGTVPMVLEELIANFIDVDGNGQYREFNRFDTPTRYTVEDPKEIMVEHTGGGLLIHGGTKEYDGISNAYPQVNLAVGFVAISTFVFRFGVETETSDNFTTIVRQSGIQFSCLDNIRNPQTINFNEDRDTDADGYPDRVDLDSDNDGIPDNVEGQTTGGYISPEGADDDHDGLDNAYEGDGDAGLTPVNTDNGTTPDYLEGDSDNDLVPDNIEGNDVNFDGEPDQTLTATDTDGDGLDDGYEGSNSTDGFDVNDEIDDPANDLPDTDGTEDVNYRDIDDDGDGINTPDEDADADDDPTNDDTDDDGTPDYLDDDGEKDPDGSTDIVVMQMVTPNNDGKNEFLWIENVHLALNNRLQIFNRWGMPVYQGEDYNNQNNVFDGRSRGRTAINAQEYLPAGVYFYIFEYDTAGGQNTTDNGYIYISQ